MCFRKLRWKVALSVLFLAFLTGCGEEPVAAGESTDSARQTEVSVSAGKEGSAESDEQSTAGPKTEMDLLMEVSDPDERYEKALKMIEPKLSNIEDGLEENLKILRIMAECKGGSVDDIFLSEKELEEAKKTVLDKIEKYHGKSAITYLGCWDYDRQEKTVVPRLSETIYNVFDDEGRLIYKNNTKAFDSYNIYESYSTDYASSGYRYAQEVYCRFDEQGRMVEITASLLSGNDQTGGVERTDRAEYDDQGNMIKRYKGDKLVEIHEYNKDGVCIKSQYKRFETVPGKEWVDTVKGRRNLDDEWRVIEYQYRKDGYLSKRTSKYYDYWDDKNASDVTNYDGTSMRKVESSQQVLLLKDQLGKTLHDAGNNGIYRGYVNSYLYLSREAQLGYVHEVDYAEVQEDVVIEDESTELLPLYYCKNNRAYMIGVVKDCGDGFAEYVQYWIQYTPAGEIRVIFCEGHALYYLPGEF